MPSSWWGGAKHAVGPAPADAAGIHVLHADADMVVVVKPAGMPSVPARTMLDPPCVARQLRDAHGPLEAVHRLDRDTSGVLVLARTAAARAALGLAFETRRARKRYLAIVHGRPKPSAGILHLPLASDPRRPPRSMVDPIHGRPATTRWRLLAAPFLERHWSLVELEPVTGRSHQLRVHLAWLGLPIVGDRLYGRDGPATAARTTPGGPLALHASWLEIPHPHDGRRMAFAADPPWRGAAGSDHPPPA